MLFKYNSVPLLQYSKRNLIYYIVYNKYKTVFFNLLNPFII